LAEGDVEIGAAKKRADFRRSPRFRRHPKPRESQSAFANCTGAAFSASSA
jgi:hypothetical protein